MKKNKINRNIILAGAIIIILIVIIVVIAYFFRYDALTNNLNKGLPVKMLFSIADEDELQFMDLFIYSPVTKKAGIYFLPANLGSKLSSLDRVDAVGVLYSREDIVALKQEVEEITGIEIDFYITFQLEDLRKLVDQVEGIELFISNPIDLVYGEKQILIPSGNVILDGDKVIDYITYEDANEEIRDSIWRKQKFLQALIKRFGEDSINWQLLNNSGFVYLRKNMDTNISSRDLRSFLHEITEFDAEHIVFQWVEGKISNIDNKKLLFPHFEGDMLKHTIQQLLETVKSSEDFDEDALTITLEILNGTLKNGLASNTASLYKQLGYEVINIANADHHDYEKTIVLDRIGGLAAAEEVADIIKCKNIHTRLNEDVVNIPQVTVILGKDFDGRYCKE